MSSTQHRCVFVGNIPYDATEDQLVQICEEVGPVVSFRLVRDRETGKPKGYGFCEFKDEETALSARRNLQGYEINGRQLRVDFAENEKGSVDRSREQGRGGPGLAQNIDVHKPISGTKAVTEGPLDQPVGFVAAASAAVVMAGMLGVSQASTMTSQGNTGSSSQQNGGEVAGTAVGTDVLTSHLAGMSRHQLYQIVSQMKDLIQQNQQQARQILIANPQLTKALFQAQIMLGMVRPPLTSLLQNVPAQAPQQQLVQQPPMQAASQPPQIHNLPQPPSMQQSSVHQGQPQMPTGQLQPLLQGTQQSQAPSVTPQSHQPLQLQHSVQTLQQPSTLLPPSQPAAPATNSLGPQPQNPAMQHGQPQPPLHLHPPPLPQQPRPLVPPSQLQHPSAQGLSFPLPHGPQSHLPQPPFQQPGGMSQNNIGLPYQSMHPPFPNQPPPQLFQVPRSGADIGAGAGIGQGGAGVLTGAVSMSIGGPSQAVRGSSLGVPSGLAPHMSWNQPLTASGSMVGVPQAMASMGMGPGHPLGGGSGINASLAGFSSNGAPPIQQGAVRSTVASEGPMSMYSQGYNQPLTQSQQQQQPQIQVPLEVEQQKALIQQVMNLTSEQINCLPLEQRQQVLQLQQALWSQTS